MFERFNEHARRALFFARYEAERLGKRTIESEHLLLGILREHDPVTAELWKAMPDVPARIAGQYAAVTDRISSSAELPVSEDVKKILAFALESTDREVDPGHLIEAILRVPECEAARRLAEHDIDAELLGIVMPSARHAVSVRTAAPHSDVLDMLAGDAQLDGTPAGNRHAVMVAILELLRESDDLRQEIVRRLRG